MTDSPEFNDAGLDKPEDDDKDASATEPQIDLDAFSADESDSSQEETDDIQIDLGALADDEKPAEDAPLNLDFDVEESGPADEDVARNLGIGQALDDEEEEPVEDEASQETQDAVDAAVERLKDDLTSKFGQWYVLHTYSGMENKVKQNLDARVQTLNMEDYIYETVVPTEEVVEIRNGARKTITRVYLPGYVLVRMDLTDESWGTVRHTPSVTGFVGQSTTPVPLTFDEVVKMLTPSVIAQVNHDMAGQAPSPKARRKVEVADYEVGESVQITDGAFAGVPATITEINVNNQRVKASVEILGRSTPVDLEFNQIEKI
ncbi:transcription termination/antitermination protein NusG [Acidipropionibacterium virtanenii]|uniref:Transcription termination/antitermination protein NusG n=1 Tax=Acidipropionibacterium virtanenii TaxID=2057246 RepID=A0A344US56_9ACTN|nr:Transcription termination/antitermination protein NusG [Acidipropionibacterium virtanenii]